MQRFASVPVRAKLLGAFGAVLTLLILLSSAAYRTTSTNQDATAEVIHTFQVISAADSLLTSLVDMETAYRGFLLSSDDQFLEPYVRGTGAFDDQIAELQALTADNPTQIRRWRTIEAQAREWRAVVTEPGIVLRRDVTAGRASPDALVAWIASGEGRRRFSAIRSAFTEALDVEERLLGQRQREAAEASERLQVVLIVGTVVAMGLAVALALVLTADIVPPITRLAAVAGTIARGDLSQRIGLRRGDEIGRAGAAFDQMAEQLQAIIGQSQAILDTAAEGIVGLDRQGRVSFANPAAARMIGLAEAAAIGQSAASWIEPIQDVPDEILTPSATPASEAQGAAPVNSTQPPSARDGLGGSPVMRALDWGSVQQGAGDLRRPGDGGRLPIEYACAPIHDAGRVVGAVLTFRDVTERRASQEALEDRARELARSNADLEQFAYVASHDLQEPLRAVVSYLQLLERRYAPQLDERAVRYIGHAVDGGKRMQTLITDLLTYSRVGRRDLALAPVDLEEVLQRVEAGLRVAIDESGATITHDPLPTIVGDATQLTQLFQNLIGNSIKFRGEQPPVIAISVEEGERAVTFSFRDNGIGIAPEYRERVFIIFQRLHGRDEYPGTGIGLAVCKKIVERHGGELWLEDSPGGGSTFHFTLATTLGGTTS